MRGFAALTALPLAADATAAADERAPGATTRRRGWRGARGASAWPRAPRRLARVGVALSAGAFAVSLFAGAATVGRKILFVQALPAAIALALVLVAY